jgi:Periplasmic glycine betaine/choline-binding (lipo)protein of an ABC-type transport system (osmoprotectant binding protein)
MRWLLVLVFGLAGIVAASNTEGAPQVVAVGSKKFTESVILGELITQLAESTGAKVLHRRELGGTRVLWNALRSGAIDVYPEYTGTIRQELLPNTAVLDFRALTRVLARVGIDMTRPLGFNNTYALGMREALAERLGIRRISDLRRYPALVFGFSSEFLERGDGWPGLHAHYQLPQRNVRGLDHELAYRGIASGAIDLTDLYSTDAEIRNLRLRVLEDDLAYFPAYDAVVLYRASLAQRAPAVVAALKLLEGAIDEPTMVDMNARVKLEGELEVKVAANFLAQNVGFAVTPQVESSLARLLRTTWQHLFLVGSSLGAALLVALPLGVLAAHKPRLGQIILGTVNIIQTIPSLALLVFMIPLLGIGALPAIAALFLYSLLPIVRNTCTGLLDVPTPLHESAQALGLPPVARLCIVELPMASRAILAGIKTAAVINVGTATLGALIGAGGYGQPILTGIRLDDMGLILEGAIPAAVLALLVQGLFELAERFLVPKGLRIKPEAH